jgi:hypothetical protein
VRSLTALTLAATLVGCGTLTPPRRTLPERIQTVYLPMPKNESYEYGFEEELARALHEEFTADGRLRPVGEPIADARLDMTIQRFERNVVAFNADDYPLLEGVEITVGFNLTEPGRQEEPTVEASVTTSDFFLADPRRSQFVPEPEWRADLMRAVALDIVNAVLTHREDEIPGGPETAQQSALVDLGVRSELGVPSVRPTPINP